jgi:hypothetical protein
MKLKTRTLKKNTISIVLPEIQPQPKQNSDPCESMRSIDTSGEFSSISPQETQQNDMSGIPIAHFVKRKLPVAKFTSKRRELPHINDFSVIDDISCGNIWFDGTYCPEKVRYKSNRVYYEWS